MERVYIISQIYYKNKPNPQFYPWLAGPEKTIRKEFENLRKKHEDKNETVEFISGDDVNMGSYFEAVFKVKTQYGYDVYWGLHSVWESHQYEDVSEPNNSPKLP